MKKKMPFQVTRCETWGRMVHYDFTTKEELINQIMKWISQFVEFNQIKSKTDRSLNAFLREMRDLYAKFLDHYDFSYIFTLYDKRISEILIEHGVGAWGKNECNTTT